MSITTTNNIMDKNLTNQYWKKNLKYLIILLSIWFTVSFGFGILLIDELNQIKIAGFKLAFGLHNKDRSMYL